MNLLSYQTLGRTHDKARLWIESRRLEPLGFSPGQPFSVACEPERLVLRPAVLAHNHVSSRALPDGRRPIIDLSSQSLLNPFKEFSELKIIASFERIEVSPSRKAFAILKSRSIQPPFKVLELFAGGGTMTAALNSSFEVVAGVEIDPDFADVWQAAHPQAMMVQSDVRAVEEMELPEFDVLTGGVPCTSHSNLGRAKKNLAGRPELGDSGDLFLPVLSLVAQRMPAAVVLENVPSFGTSLAGQLVTQYLKRLGYEVAVHVLKPHAEWGQIEDRPRWLLVATLDRPFTLRIPEKLCAETLDSFLDAPDEARDRADAGRIARTVEGLREHQRRHAALGHGFGFSVVDRAAVKIPVIPKSYHKINSGPFVSTSFGPRLLRQSEIERIHGSAIGTRHYATAVRIMGQGVQVPVFQEVFRQVARHLMRG